MGAGYASGPYFIADWMNGSSEQTQLRLAVDQRRGYKHLECRSSAEAKGRRRAYSGSTQGRAAAKQTERGLSQAAAATQARALGNGPTRRVSANPLRSGTLRGPGQTERGLSQTAVAMLADRRER